MLARKEEVVMVTVFSRLLHFVCIFSPQGLLETGKVKWVKDLHMSRLLTRNLLILPLNFTTNHSINESSVF